MIEVPLPDGKILELPDDTSASEIEQAIATYIAEVTAIEGYLDETARSHPNAEQIPLEEIAPAAEPHPATLSPSPAGAIDDTPGWPPPWPAEFDYASRRMPTDKRPLAIVGKVESYRNDDDVIAPLLEKLPDQVDRKLGVAREVLERSMRPGPATFSDFRDYKR
jgi:hypothetical protein